jgi:hypothetical protein
MPRATRKENANVTGGAPCLQLRPTPGAKRSVPSRAWSARTRENIDAEFAPEPELA